MTRAIYIIASCVAAWSMSVSAEEALAPRQAPSKLTLQQLQSIPASSQITVKFREGSGFRLRNGQLTASEASDVGVFQKTLGELGIPASGVSRLFTRPEETLDAERQEGQQRSGKQLADLNLYYVIDLPKGVNPATVANGLNQLSVVEFAEPRPLPAPPPAESTPDITSRQGYKSDAPQGIGVPAPGQIRGSDGAGMRAVDLEYSWRLDHEDLNLGADRIQPIPGCVPEDPFNDKNHGTAVLGEVVAAKNAYGVTGAAPGARILVVPTGCSAASGGYRPDAAIDFAASLLDPGEVIIIEQQNRACGGACGRDQVGCGPAEAIQSIFDVIQRATSLGRIVVEAAGNGRVDLDGPACGGAFNRNLRDSGAIIVGAGSATDHRRLAFSSYGSRVDVQGWGENVATTGYGDAFNAADETRRYTYSFGGTSSATPIVSSAVLSINGIRKACGRPLASPFEMRSLLAATGTPQTNPQGGAIGPLPNIRAALAAMRDLGSCQHDGAATASDAATLTGQWMIGDSGAILSISEGSRWIHPAHGAAKIRLGDDASDLKVFYEQGSARCSYKIAFSEHGQTLDLMAADLSQDSDYCPEGSLTRVGSGGER